jgi:hypothetical protein
MLTITLLTKHYKVDSTHQTVPNDRNTFRSFQFKLFGDTKMTQKKEITPVASKAVTETEATQVNPETKADTTTQQIDQSQPTEQAEQATKSTRTVRGATSISDLSPELVELVTELRDTVKRIDPRKHTEKTLRRVLFNISDILKDIEALYTKS